jgi:hypothetical protein
MGDFLSKISGQITGSIILGAFFPVVLFVIAVVLLVLPLTPYAPGLTAIVTILKIWEDKTSAAVVTTVVVLILSVVLYMLNVPIIRLYEGYPWRDSWIGTRLKSRQRSRFDAATTLREAARSLDRELRRKNLNGSVSGVLTRLGRLLNDEFPNSSDNVLPTRLGNVIRSFETYSLVPYGMPAIAVWPRLMAVVPATYAQGLDGAQTSFNFMLNCSFLSMVLASMLTFAGLFWADPFRGGADRLWIVWVLVFLALWRLFYYGAINRAGEWGTQVRAAIDLYRGELLKQLGYDFKPETPEEERRIWELINYKFSFPDERSAEVPYKQLPTALAVEPLYVLVTAARTVAIVDDTTLRVAFSIENADPFEFDASRVILRDEVPDGYSYVSGSATVNENPARTLDVNPVRIDLGAVPAKKSCTAVYQLRVVPKKENK